MKQMAVQKLQDHGYIFLWVTGRAIELGRECLEIWGLVYTYILCLLLSVLAYNCFNLQISQMFI